MSSIQLVNPERVILVLEKRPRCLKDLRPGWYIPTSATRTVTGGEIDESAKLMGDKNRLNLDKAYAISTNLGLLDRIAQGALCLGIAMGLVKGGSDADILFQSVVQWEFVKPVYPDDELSATAYIVAVGEANRLTGLGGVELFVRLYNQNRMVVQLGTWKALVAARSE